MNRQEQLNDEIVWNEDGHLSEIARCTLADGQNAILPDEAMAHFSRCAACSTGVGEAALFSVGMSAALDGARQRTLPWIPIGAALVVAVGSALPLLSTARRVLGALGWFVVRGTPMIGHAVLKLAAHGVGAPLYFTCTVVLLAMGFLVARPLSQGAVK